MSELRWRSHQSVNNLKTRLKTIFVVQVGEQRLRPNSLKSYFPQPKSKFWSCYLNFPSAQECVYSWPDQSHPTHSCSSDTREWWIGCLVLPLHEPAFTPRARPRNVKFKIRKTALESINYTNLGGRKSPVTEMRPFQWVTAQITGCPWGGERKSPTIWRGNIPPDLSKLAVWKSLSVANMRCFSYATFYTNTGKKCIIITADVCGGRSRNMTS